MSPRLAALLILMLGACASADAQNPYVRNPRSERALHGGRQGVMVQQGELTGTVEDAMRSIVLDSNGHAWHVNMQGAKIEVTGTANADYLRSGMTVEFKAEVDAQGKVKEKVGELKVVSPSADKKIGMVLSDSAAEDKAAEGGNAKPSKPAKRGTVAKGAKAGSITPGTYNIVGRLVVGSGSKLTVKAGRHQVSLELSDQPKIDVDLADLSAVAKGDKISAKGIKAAPRGGVGIGQFKAAEVKIELAEPLSGGKKKASASKSDTKRPAKRDKPDGGQAATDN